MCNTLTPPKPKKPIYYCPAAISDSFKTVWLRIPMHAMRYPVYEVRTDATD